MNPSNTRSVTSRNKEKQIKYNLYQSKTPDLLKKYKFYKKAREIIQIIPVGKNDFDVISFIEFAMSINAEFCVLGKMTTISNSNNSQILVFKRSYVEEQLNKGDTSQIKYSFRIVIGENFDFINVYVYFNLNQFLFPVEYNDHYIAFIQNENNAFRMDGNFDNYKSDSLLRQTGVYFANLKRKCPKCLRTMFIEFQSKSTQILKSKVGQTNDFLLALQHFPGSFIIYVQELSEDGYAFSIDTDSIPTSISIDEKLSIHLKQNKGPVTLQSLVVVFPWAPILFRYCNFIELDASFRGTRPYCFCVPNCIINNESYPLGLSIAPTESEILYSQIIDGAEKVGINRNDWKSKSILSDMGPSLIAFTNHFCNFHFFCHRHILEFFGANSGLCIFVSKLLHCYSLYEYDEKRIAITNQLNFLIKLRKTLNLHNDKFDEKSKVLKIMLSGNECDISNKWHFSHWGLWLRYGVSTCSNHSEGFHRKCSTLCSSPNSNFLTKFSKITQKVLKHASKVQINNGKSIRRKCIQRRDHLLNSLKSSKHNFKYYSRTKCNCMKTEYLSFLYGVSFPCKHCLLSGCIDDINKLGFSDEEVDKILINILSFDSNSKCRTNLQENIIQSLIINYPDTNPDILRNLVHSLMNCIYIQHPNCVKFPLNFDFQLMNIRLEKKVKIGEDKNQNNNNNNGNDIDDNQNSAIPKVKILKDSDDEFWYQNIQSEIIKKAMMLKHETIYEIEYVYPALKANQMSIKICDMHFVTHFQQKNESELNESFKEFKINCWAEADRIMNQKKFLD